mmetsp:Transcript_23285/g.48353  ORF Transcript_23285/g.48353 Transcript_23285/m.48353 type:complete len:237 (+) Transcript_23285:1376-2086(+)
MRFGLVFLRSDLQLGIRVGLAEHSLTSLDIHTLDHLDYEGAELSHGVALRDLLLDDRRRRGHDGAGPNLPWRLRTLRGRTPWSGSPRHAPRRSTGRAASSWSRKGCPWGHTPRRSSPRLAGRGAARRRPTSSTTATRRASRRRPTGRRPTSTGWTAWRWPSTSWTSPGGRTPWRGTPGGRPASTTTASRRASRRSSTGRSAPGWGTPWGGTPGGRASGRRASGGARHRVRLLRRGV